MAKLFRSKKFIVLLIILLIVIIPSLWLWSYINYAPLTEKVVIKLKDNVPTLNAAEPWCGRDHAYYGKPYHTRKLDEFLSDFSSCTRDSDCRAIESFEFYEGCFPEYLITNKEGSDRMKRALSEAPYTYFNYCGGFTEDGTGNMPFSCHFADYFVPEGVQCRKGQCLLAY